MTSATWPDKSGFRYPDVVELFVHSFFLNVYSVYAVDFVDCQFVFLDQTKKNGHIGFYDNLDYLLIETWEVVLNVLTSWKITWLKSQGDEVQQHNGIVEAWKT